MIGILDAVKDVKGETKAFNPKFNEIKLAPAPVSTKAQTDQQKDNVQKVLQLMSMNRNARRRYGKFFGFKISGSTKPFKAKNKA